MSFVHEGMTGCVAALFVSIDGEKVLAGTCFLLGQTSQYQLTLFPYIVTAKHVQSILRGREAFIRLNRREPKDGVWATYLPLPDNWAFHENDEVDLAVLPIDREYLANEDAKFHFIWIDSILASHERIKGKGATWPPTVGEEVSFSAMLSHHTGKKRNVPYVRLGHLSLVTEETIIGHEGKESDYYLIDAQCYPGNSGAPVWVCYDVTEDGTNLAPGKYAVVLGVLSSGYPHKEELVEMTVEGKVAKHTYNYFSLGISLVTPIEKVAAIINKQEFKDIRDNIDREKAKGNQPYPVSSIPVTGEKPFTQDDFEKALKKVSRKMPEPDRPSDSGQEK
jgi:hypothetical protein